MCFVLTTLLIMIGEVFMFIIKTRFLQKFQTLKICHFIEMYRSPSQTKDKFQTFKSNLESNLDVLSRNNPFLTVLIVDFKTKLRT